MTTICNLNRFQRTKRNFRPGLLLVAAMPLCVGVMHAQIVEYPIDELDNGTGLTPLPAINVNANISASALSMNGLSRISWAQSLSTSSFPVGSVNTSKNYEFTITPNSGYTITYSTLTYGIWRLDLPSGETLNWELHASTDGFASSDLTLDVYSHSPTILGDVTVNSDISALGTQSGAITFRLYAYDLVNSGAGGLSHRSGSGWTSNGSNVLLGGSVSAVPETETMAFASGAVLMVFAAYRRLR